MTLFHTSDREIRQPDIHIGRSNADFGQGFYLSLTDSFAGAWARNRRPDEVYVNRYDADFSGLKVKTFERSTEWFRYIFSNRQGRKDYLAEYDVIIGPVANDTLFETFGIVTSGLVTEEQAVSLLSIGPIYIQIAVKTEKGIAALRWESSHTMTDEVIEEARRSYREENEKFEKAFAETLENM